jgi:hypothetical protein
MSGGISMSFQVEPKRALHRLRRLAAASFYVLPLMAAAAFAGEGGNGVLLDDPHQNEPRQVPVVLPFNEIAQQAAPDGPIPGIDFGVCDYHFCHYWQQQQQQHGEHHPFYSPDRALIVDCSGQMRGAFRSVNEAIRHSRQNGTILVLPPDKGRTCEETVQTGKAVTIATYGGGGAAVIQAPPGAPCLTAHLPLGDSLVLDGIKFISHREQRSCLNLEAGRIVVRNSMIDSRRSGWAFVVADSVELRIENSMIVTDHNGLYAYRAKLDLHNLDINIDLGRSGAAMYLDGADGLVEGGTINGGVAGILASSGTEGLRISGTIVRKAQIGVNILPGGLGEVTASRLTVTGGDIGIMVAPDTDASIADSAIIGTRHAGARLYEGKIRFSGNMISDAENGIVVAPPGRYPMFRGQEPDVLPPDTDDMPAFKMGWRDIAPPDGFNPPEGARWSHQHGEGQLDGLSVTDNIVANVRLAGILFRPQAGGRAMGNIIYAPRPAVCMIGRGAGGNSCHTDPPPPTFWERLLHFGADVGIGDVDFGAKVGVGAVGIDVDVGRRH